MHDDWCVVRATYDILIEQTARIYQLPSDIQMF